MFRRKLWKRVLPAILSVAMVLETVPATALAAEYQESEVVEEAALEKNEEEAEKDDAQNGIDDVQDQEDDSQTEIGNVSEDNNTTADENITAKEPLEESSENKTQTADADVKDDNVENAAENVVNTAAALDTKIIVDKEELAYYCNRSSSYKYDVDKEVVLVKYDENNNDPFNSLLTRIKSSYIDVEVDGKTNNTLTESLNYQWQKTDGTSLAAGAVPVEAGDYMLVVTLDAVDSVCSKAEVKIPFTIAKRQLFVELSDEYVMPGTTVGAWKAKFNYILNRETTDWDSETTEDITEEKASYIDTVSLTVYNAYQMETALADDAKLLEGTDYVVSVKPVLKQTVSSNYAISEETILKIKSYGRIDTWIEATQKKPEELITKVYDETSQKQISYETEIKDKLTVTVKAYDENTVEGVTLDNAAVTEVWFNGAKEELGEGAEFEPQTAGTYYIGFRYYPTEDDAKIYKACKESDYIRVVIERAPLTLVPALKDGAEVFYTGMTEADVLKYADYTLLNAKNEEMKIDRDIFWGVSYDDIEEVYGYSQTNTKQSYEPVFQLIRAEKDTSGNPVKDEDGKEIWTENNNQLLEASKYCYRLVFTGKKTVYTRAGVEVSDKRVDVNGSDVDAEDKNHTIVTTADVLLANYVDVSVAEAKKTKIDVSGIVQENFNTTNLNHLYQPTKLVSKVYDGKALYEPSRAEYKKAVVTSTEDNQEVAKNYDSAIRYTWYKINSVKAVYDETDPENPKQTGWEVANKTSMSSNSIPTAAGEYMLEIRFAKTGYVSCTETIYYRIDKQLLIVDFEKIPGAYKNETVDSYTYAVHYDGEYNVYVVPENQYSDSVKTEDNLLKDWHKISFYDELSDYPYSGYYKLNWYVEQIRLDENNAPAKDDNGNIIYDRLGEYDRLSTPGENNYRLGVTLTTRDSNYTNYEIVYDAEMSPTPKYTNVYHNDFENVFVYEVEAGTVGITLELDTEKLVTTKDYDGKPFYASVDEALEAVVNALTIKYAESGNVVAQTDWPKLVYDVYDQEADERIDFDEMVYGGSYTLSLYALSDAKYQFAYLDEAANYTINKIPLTVTPVLTEDIPAGTYAGYNTDGVIYNLSKTAFLGYAEADAEAFQYGTPVYTGSNGTKTLGFGAYAYEKDGEYHYNTLSATVSKEGTANSYYGYIKYGKEYAVKFAGALAYPYSRNYDVTYARTIFGATRRGNSTAGSESFEGVEETAFARRVDGAAVIITPTSAIPYMKNLDTTDSYENPISGEGNYFAFRINAPYEFYEDNGSCLEKYYKNFIYRSSIETAGGFILQTADNYIKVVFPVKEKAKKSFDIIWENGYTEKYTIDFTNVVLEEDLTKAVAPKSLSFNGVNTKMVVGDEQQLDVKIKKAQINDVIYIDYQVTQGKDVISVTTDDSKGIAGYATALKPGKATITAVPVKLVNGVKTKIDGAKAATVSITVSDVTAPVIKKVAASDKKVTFTYLKPANGYRREVYVLAGKKKAEDFETLIRSTNNGQWRGIFAVQPQYYVNELVDAKTITEEMNIGGLLANGEYTLYVRNVSAIRTLEDGSCVQLSAKGTVKTFKTTKPQVEALRLYAKNDADILVTSKNVKLADKTEQLYTMGQFSTIDIDAAADTTDKSWLTLPLDKAYGKEFVAPKLVYTVSSEPDGLDWVEVSKIRDFRNYTYIGGRYYKKTDIATVDKTGKVTFKGVGKVYVIVYDQAAEEKKAQVTLNIYATADSIKAKDGKLAVGKGLYLSSLLTYSEGKTALTGMDYQNTGMIGTTYKPNLTILAEEVTKINNEGNFYLRYTGDGDYYIYAKKPNATCSIALSDGTLSASLKIQSTPIEPVKDFKITDIADDRFTISFSYPVETYLNGVTYRVDITDARGSLVDSLLYDADSYTSYDGKKKVFTRVVNYQNDKIVRLSKYDVSVTTLCADEASAKPVKKAVKTTDFPANYGNLGSASYGGAAVYVYSIAGGTETYNITLQHREYLTSGNTYTLRAAVSSYANYRMTDTVTWKSTNPKVATVKAKAGTYTAQLNALKPGITEIELTSKITKKVFARWPVFVKAVGNAETYYGDYEFTWEYPFSYDPYYTSGMEVLTLQNPVRVTSSELGNNADYNYKWVKFTAPVYGRYKFNCTDGVLEQVLSSSEDKKISVSDINNHYNIAILEGETLYFKVRGAFTMQVSDYTKQGASFTVDDDSVSIDSDSKQIIEFRATEDNVYSFYSKELPFLSMGIYDETFSTVTSNTRTDDGIQKRDVSLGTGEIIYLEVPSGKYTLYVEKRNAAALVNSAALSLTDQVKEQWYTYTVSEDGLYTFQSKDATSVLTAEYYESLKDLKATDWNVTNNGNDFSGRMMLEAGQKIAFKMSASEAMTATIIVTPEIPVKLSIGEEKDIPVNADSRRWITFTLPEAGRYRFSAVPTEADAAYDVNLRYFKNAIEENEITTIEKNELIVSDYQSYQPDIAKGDTVYVEITTNKEGLDAANVKVSLTQVTATELTIGEEQTITVKNGKEWWYTFTPPQQGNYIVQSVVTPNVGTDGEETDTHTLSAAWYIDLEQRNSSNKLFAIGTHDIYGESIGYSKQRLFKVSADDLGLGGDDAEITTTATIIVKELTATPLELNQPLEISLLKNERRWYSFTAPETNTYLFQKTIAEGSVYSSYGNVIKDTTMTDMNTEKDSFPIDLEKGQTIYIEEHENKGGPVTFTRSIDCVSNISGKVEETIQLTSNTPKYYRYTADIDNYYKISYTTEPEDAEVTVSWRYAIDSTDYKFLDNYDQFPLEANEKRYFKVSTTSETSVSVTLRADPAEVVPLIAGEPKEIEVEPGGESNYTWYSFTAETAGRYRISAQNEITNGGVHIDLFSSMIDKKTSVKSERDYETGETVYVAVFNYNDVVRKATLSVEKIEPNPMEGSSVDEKISKETIKDYSYTASKTGIYSLKNESYSGVEVYVYIDDDCERVYVGTPKEIFLKKDDVIYIKASYINAFFPSDPKEASVKFSVTLEDEPQMLSSENEPATIEYDGQDWKLIAFTAEETALYNFDIVYSKENSAGYDDYVYYMNHSQIMWVNDALYGREAGEVVAENKGNHEVHARLLFKGETGYLYIPWLDTEATIEASRFPEVPIVETLKVNESTVHAFKMKDEVDAVGDQVGDRVWYVFDAPGNGDYELTFDWEGYSVQYQVKCYQNGLKQLSSAASFYQYINPRQSFDISGIKKKQRVCFVITKRKGSLDEQQLTVTVTKK